MIAKRSRVLAKKRKQSNSRLKAKRLLGKAHAKVSNQRLNHARHLAKRVCAKYDLVSIEDLNIKGMIEKKDQRFKLQKLIQDVSWGLFASCLKSKAEEAGKTVCEVDPRGTSQRCSECSTVIKKALWERVHRCPQCGLILGRDHNAAINIDALGLSVVQ